MAHRRGAPDAAPGPVLAIMTDGDSAVQRPGAGQLLGDHVQLAVGVLADRGRKSNARPAYLLECSRFRGMPTAAPPVCRVHYPRTFPGSSPPCSPAIPPCPDFLGNCP